MVGQGWSVLFDVDQWKNSGIGSVGEPHGVLAPAANSICNGSSHPALCLCLVWNKAGMSEVKCSTERSGFKAFVACQTEVGAAGRRCLLSCVSVACATFGGVTYEVLLQGREG